MFLRFLGSLVLAITFASPASAQSSWNARHTAHFDIYYRAGQNDVDGFARDAERAYARISFDLSRQLDDRVALVLTRTQNDPVTAAEIGDGYPGRRLLLLPVDATGDWRTTLAHELTHQFELHLMIAVRDIPAWFSEGLADHEANTWPEADVAAIRELVASGSVPNAEAFDPADRRWGHALFDFVAAEYGLRGLRQYAVAANSAALGVAPDDFDWAFKMYLRSRFAE